MVWVRYLFKGKWKQCSHYSLNIFIDALILLVLRLGIPLQSGLKFQGIDENHLSLTCDRANSRGNAPIGNERNIVERLFDGFNGVAASRLDSVELRERKRAQESYRCKCCSFWQRLLSSLGVLFKGQSDHYTHLWGRSTLGSVRLLRME
jgi:hypothetical protein